MAKLAIVIPVYNAVSSLEKTVASVLAQSFADFELWLVDDGSVDGTGALIDRLAKTDERIRVIHQANIGCYGARLVALKRIKTPYFAFADADDTLTSVMYEKMIGLAEREHLDVVQCAHYERGRVCNLWSGEMILPDQQAVRCHYVQGKILDVREACFVWNKVYRNQYDFEGFDTTDRVTNFEDLIFNIQFFIPVKRMGFVNEPLYNYEIVEGSAVHSYSADKVKDFCEAGRVRRLFAPRYGMAVDDPAMTTWTVRNAANAVLTAATASRLRVAQRAAFVRELLALPEVVRAVELSKVGRAVWIIRFARILPSRLVVIALCILKMFRG